MTLLITVPFSQYGSDHGRLVIYFHGAPGGPDECALFESYAKAHGLSVICFDRFAVHPSISGERYYRFLAEQILTKAAGEKVAVIGFSIGAFIALQTCRYLTGKVRSLHLISAAAPLEAGNFLDNMAGKSVFQLARVFPGLFVQLSYAQGLLALFFPKALFRLLFAKPLGADQTLAANHAFQRCITKIVQSCFIGHVQGYTRDIAAYVRPWNATLSEISVNTFIWHGAEDNWSPRAMADYLKSAIPGCSQIEIMRDLSHYSCLYNAVPLICKQLLKDHKTK